MKRTTLIALAIGSLAILSSTGAEARHRHHHKHHHHRHHYRMVHIASAPTPGWTGDLASKARAYMGTNPTGWRRVWCGRFMAMVAPELASRISNPNMARSWAELPHTSPHVGAIAVLSRRRGGHVGVVTGFAANGNPIIVSGNHGHRVGEGQYSKYRVLAYVSG